MSMRATRSARKGSTKAETKEPSSQEISFSSANVKETAIFAVPTTLSEVKESSAEQPVTTQAAPPAPVAVPLQEEAKAESRPVPMSDDAPLVPSTPPSGEEESAQSKKRKAEDIEKEVEQALGSDTETDGDEQSSGNDESHADESSGAAWRAEWPAYVEKFNAEHKDAPKFKKFRCCPHSKCNGNRNPTKREKKPPVEKVHKTEWGRFRAKFKQEHPNLNSIELAKQAKLAYVPTSGKSRSVREMFTAIMKPMYPTWDKMEKGERENAIRAAFRQHLRDTVIA